MNLDNSSVRSSFQILNDFLNKNEFKLDTSKILKYNIDKSKNPKKLPNDILERIIFDAYESGKKIIKNIINTLEKNYNLIIGRLLKGLLKKYVDYQFEDYFLDFFQYFQIQAGKVDKEKLKKLIEININSENYTLARNISLNKFKKNLQKAKNENNESRIFDYVNFLYSRVLNLNEFNKISLIDVYKDNLTYVKKELDQLEHKILQNFCDNNKLDKRETIVKKFNEKYIEILEKRENYEEKVSIAILTISEDLFIKFPNRTEFYSYLFILIKRLYSDVRNHRKLVIKIENIIFENVNIKWEIFVYLSIYAEKFLKQRETRAYYKPEEILKDTVQSLYNLEINEKELNLIKNFYKNKIKLNELNDSNISKIPNFDNILEDFKFIYTGFTFEDCFILRFNNKLIGNSKELSFIENKNELLLIFSKHKFNDAKIPCPICGSLKISGNSYPKVGIRSWECKNPLCGERSKTNRGKRYSERTIFMQDSILDLSSENLISKELIKKWRKDIVNINSEYEIYQMLIKYYSYKNDCISIIQENDKKTDLFEKLKGFCKSERRKLKLISPSKIIEFPTTKREFEDFFNSKKFSYVNHFLFNPITFIEDKSNNFNFIYSCNNRIKLIQGNCYEVMQQLKINSVDCMVTSPPYYNAREYSQWSNLYSYLNDMYKIILLSKFILKPGAVFVFNIGDVYGNPNTTVKSKMGEKRIILGSYVAFLFLKAGFVLLENFIWNKGEPQSQRHKNDGILTPYYQKPTNCYEHIFIFKKGGAPLKLNKNLEENPWENNIPKFTPVIKIDANGENRFGHSAPFPFDIPKFASKCFTNKNEIILDPFSGSLTSAIEATKNNRIGVGIELLEDYIELSVERANENNLSIEFYNTENGKLKIYNSSKGDNNQYKIDKYFMLNDKENPKKKQNSSIPSTNHNNPAI